VPFGGTESQQLCHAGSLSEVHHGLATRWRHEVRHEDPSQKWMDQAQDLSHVNSKSIQRRRSKEKWFSTESSSCIGKGENCQLEPRSDLFPEDCLRAVNLQGVKDLRTVSGSIRLHALPPPRPGRYPVQPEPPQGPDQVNVLLL
jgi:hypothetical protein